MIYCFRNKQTAKEPHQSTLMYWNTIQNKPSKLKSSWPLKCQLLFKGLLKEHWMMLGFWIGRHITIDQTGTMWKSQLSSLVQVISIHIGNNALVWIEPHKELTPPTKTNMYRLLIWGLFCCRKKWNKKTVFINFCTWNYKWIAFVWSSKHWE